MEAVEPGSELEVSPRDDPAKREATSKSLTHSQGQQEPPRINHVPQVLPEFLSEPFRQDSSNVQSFASPLTRALNGGAFPLHFRMRSVTSIFSLSASQQRSGLHTDAEVNAMMNTKWNSRLHNSAAWLWGAGLIAVGVAWLIHH
jgi:hypothetical protein